jgi:hypothetical protein
MHFSDPEKRQKQEVAELQRQVLYKLPEDLK